MRYSISVETIGPPATDFPNLFTIGAIQERQNANSNMDGKSAFSLGDHELRNRGMVAW
jgi:hypothetical protein